MTVAIVVLVIALGSLSGTVVSTAQLTRSNEETAIASAAAQRMAAELQTIEFSQIFATYNGNPLDDPSGVGTAPGGSFDVLGLNPRRDDADGLCGTIEFPIALVGGGPQEELRENIDNDALGMPRDLNGDGIDANDHATDYLVLPVTIRVQWVGSGGNGEVRMDLILVQ